MKVQGDVAHFIQKQRPAVGHLKPADFLLQRAGEGAALVAKQFALEQSGRNRGAVQRDKRQIPARTDTVNRPRHQLFAGAGFTENQHGGVSRGDYFEQLFHPVESGAGSHHLFKHLLALHQILAHTLRRVTRPEVLYEGNPAERAQFQRRRRHQDRDAATVLANQLLFEWRAGAEPQRFFVCQFVQRQVFGRGKIGPAQLAGG